MSSALAAADADDIQGLLRSAYRTLPFADYGLYHLSDPEGGRHLLQRLVERATATSARRLAVATQVALTSSGLAAIGVPSRILAGFSFEFLGGMNSDRCSRFLGDHPSGWVWGSPDGVPVHLLVATFADSEAQLADAVGGVDALAASSGGSVIYRINSRELSSTEPFGFRDGISEPFVEELSTGRQREEGGPRTPVPLGEFVLGYPNMYGLQTQRPVLPLSLDPGRVLPALAPGEDRGNPDGGADLGRNGSYLVVRTLSQDTEAFASYLEASAAATGLEADLLAAKMVGRWRGGAPLALSPEVDHPDLAFANDFGYHTEDPSGLKCPLGAHVRRANPRDSLDPRPGSAKSLAVTDRHRLLRRGRIYTDGQEKGLQFLALNANIGRQFEFIQHTWLNSSKFGGLYDDVDPILGPRSSDSVFTMPAEPIRTRLSGLPDFVNTRGGAYLFLPGIRALRYLGTGAWSKRRHTLSGEGGP